MKSAHLHTESNNLAQSFSKPTSVAYCSRPIVIFIVSFTECRRTSALQERERFVNNEADFKRSMRIYQ